MRKRTRDVLKEFFNLKDSSKIFLFFIFSFMFLRNYFILGIYKAPLLAIKIGYPILAIFFAYAMSCIGAFGWKYIARKKLKKNMGIRNQKLININLRTRESEILVVGIIAFLFFLVVGVLTKFNLLYTLLALIFGSFVGRIIIKKLMEKK